MRAYNRIGLLHERLESHSSFSGIEGRLWWVISVIQVVYFYKVMLLLKMALYCIQKLYLSVTYDCKCTLKSEMRAGMFWFMKTDLARQVARGFPHHHYLCQLWAHPACRTVLYTWDKAPLSSSMSQACAGPGGLQTTCSYTTGTTEACSSTADSCPPVSAGRAGEILRRDNTSGQKFESIVEAGIMSITTAKWYWQQLPSCECIVSCPAPR